MSEPFNEALAIRMQAIRERHDINRRFAKSHRHVCSQLDRAINNLFSDQPKGHHWEQQNNFTPGFDETGEWPTAGVLVRR